MLGTENFELCFSFSRIRSRRLRLYERHNQLSFREWHGYLWEGNDARRGLADFVLSLLVELMLHFLLQHDFECDVNLAPGLALYGVAIWIALLGRDVANTERCLKAGSGMRVGLGQTT